MNARTESAIAESSATTHASARELGADCLHCGTPIPANIDANDEDAAFCCRGCAAVYRLVHDAGLARYYDLGGGAGHPIDRAESSDDHKWLEPILEKIGKSTSPFTRVVLDVQGVHCAACVWLLEKLFLRGKGAGKIEVNPAVGSIELTLSKDFPLARWVTDVEAFGYRLGPPIKAGERDGAAASAQRDLIWRMGVTIAIAMNTMIFGFSVYCGLTEGPVFRLFHGLDFALSFVSVLVGGTVFFRSALLALKQRMLHLDLPIALGILLVFVSSTYTYLTRGGATSYFDTLNVFIALMLVGRFLQERILTKNRAMLLASDGADGIFTRRATDHGVATIRCTEVKLGDVLLLGRGDIVPVDAALLEKEAALFSLDWINGESAPRSFEPGETIPAGAFSHGAQAVRVQAAAPFEQSQLVSLLRTSTRRDHDVARSTSWHTRLTRVYVALVLALATLGFLGWYLATRDLTRALDVVAAVLIVTCPCAFGIATPLAYELAQGGLRRFGLYVRTPGFLDRAAEVGSVVFDKTGTLTTGRLVVRDDEIVALSSEERARLYALAARSSHPKSQAIVDAIDRTGGVGVFDANESVVEIVGKGLELRRAGATYRLGAQAWAVALAKVPQIGATYEGDVVFTRDGVILASFVTKEELRADARDEVQALKSSGYDVFVLSGDALEPTRALARSCGIPEEHAFGGRSPVEKAEWMRSAVHAGGSHKRTAGKPKMLFVGDGINDSLVAEEAYCAGTPAIDRPFMASRSDFYFVTPGLRPIRFALAVSHELARTVRLNLTVALFYNAITLGLALAGLMTPLLCAILMPVSSVSTVLATTAQLSRRRLLRKLEAGAALPKANHQQGALAWRS